MVDIRVLSLLFCLRRRLSVDGLCAEVSSTSLLSHKYPGNCSAHGCFLRPTSCLYATLSPTINLHRVPLYLISLTKLTILHGMGVLKVQSTTHFPERQLGHALLFGSCGFSVGVCCSQTRGTRDSYFWTPGVGYTRWHISFLSPCRDLYHSASTIIGLAIILVSRMYDTLPSCVFMCPCGVVTTWGRSKRHGARICFPLALHIPAGDCAISSLVSDYAVQNDDLMHIVAIKGLHSCSPRPAFHDRFLESHLRRLSYC
ncbi:hypothetical protein V8E53_009180 [Lactarius tabidus]